MELIKVKAEINKQKEELVYSWCASLKKRDKGKEILVVIKSGCKRK